VKDTEVTVTGNVVNPPQRNRTASGSSVTNFRIASTSRRYDRETQGWVDNKTLFLDVECWNELGGNVSHSVSKGDPVIVFGTLFTEEWESDQGRRSRVKLRAEAVGPDLNRGVADFRRAARTPATAVPPAPGEPGEIGEVGAVDTDPGDYTAGAAALYELDPDTAPEPALH
jgi:single-strand DNA-binding protein